jgi:hypothetical protein
VICLVLKERTIQSHMFSNRPRKSKAAPTAAVTALKLLKRINSTYCRDSIIPIINLILSIDIRLEIHILQWISPVLTCIPYASVSCPLSFAVSPLNRCCLCLLHDSPSGRFDGIVKVPFKTADDVETSGLVNVALYPGDCVNLLYQPDVWYTIHEIRPQTNTILVASTDEDITEISKGLSATQRKHYKNYKEFNPIFFLGCMVKREAILGPLNNVYNDWDEQEPTLPEDSIVAAKVNQPRTRKVFFRVPVADARQAIAKLKKMIEKCIDKAGLAGSMDSALTSQTTDRKLRPQRDNFSSGGRRPNEHQMQRNRAEVKNASLLDPVEMHQRRKHVEVWALRKAEIHAAAAVLAGIDPFPSSDEIGAAMRRQSPCEAPSSEYTDGLTAIQFRRRMWLQVGQALRSIGRSSPDAHILLAAWKLWTRRAHTASEKHNRSSSSSSRGHSSPSCELPRESQCAPAWYAQRLPTNCDKEEVVEARTFFRRRMKELKDDGKNNGSSYYM